MFPHGIDEAAPVVSRQSVVIAAPLDVVWQLHVRVEEWPRWQPQLEAPHLSGEFAPGSALSWRSGVYDVESTIYRVDDRQHTLWGGTTAGVRGIHAFTFTPDGTNVRAESAESWDGTPVIGDPLAARLALDDELLAWLRRLAAAAEA